LDWYERNNISGVTIGDGAVIGANSLVTKDVEPYIIIGGNPAIPIRKRFDQQTIDRLLRIKWWDWDIEKIKEMCLICILTKLNNSWTKMNHRNFSEVI